MVIKIPVSNIDFVFIALKMVGNFQIRIVNCIGYYTFSLEIRILNCKHIQTKGCSCSKMVNLHYHSPNSLRLLFVTCQRTALGMLGLGVL
jgi:hypothetical protein